MDLFLSLDTLLERAARSFFSDLVKSNIWCQLDDAIQIISVTERGQQHRDKSRRRGRFLALDSCMRVRVCVFL